MSDSLFENKESNQYEHKSYHLLTDTYKEFKVLASFLHKGNNKKNFFSYGLFSQLIERENNAKYHFTYICMMMNKKTFKIL